MKKLIVTALMSMAFALTGFESNAQTVWTTIDTINNVIISYQVDSLPCYGETAMFLKIENTGTTDVTVSWSLWGNGIYKEIVLTGMQEVTGNCNDVTPPYPLIERIPLGETINSMNPIINIY